MVLVALALVVFFGFMALAIDTGHWFAVKNELRNAADSLALAGARAYYPYRCQRLSVPVTPIQGLAAVAGDQRSRMITMPIPKP